jgi:hypothetical protein
MNGRTVSQPRADAEGINPNFMRKIDYELLASWCGDRRYEIPDWVPTLPCVTERVRCSVTQLHQLPELLDQTVNLASGVDRLVWIRDWTIWSERSQEIGLSGLELIERFLPQEQRELESHAFLLNDTEWREAINLLVPPLVFGWDAHLLFETGDILADISHHGQITVSFNLQSEHKAVRLSAWRDGGKVRS